MPVKVVATDVDGTLIATDHSIRDDTAALYRQVFQRIPILLCTGRALGNAQMACARKRPDLQISFFPGVYNHGAVAFGKDRQDIVYRDCIDQKQLAGLLNIIYEARSEVITAHETKHLYDPATCLSYKLDADSMIDDVHTYAVTLYRIDSIIVDHKTAAFDTFCNVYEEWPEKFMDRDFTAADLTDVLYFSLTAAPCVLYAVGQIIAQYVRDASASVLKSYLPVPESLHILPAQISKAKALEALCEKYHWDKETILAIGDSDNDVEMLRWAGYSVAMGNGSRSVFDVARCKTAHSVEGGWAKAMKHFVCDGNEGPITE